MLLPGSTQKKTKKTTKGPSQEQQHQQQQPEIEKNDDNDDITDMKEEIVLRLNEDGSFDPYTSASTASDGVNYDGTSSTNKNNESDQQHHTSLLHDVLSRGGSWAFQDGKLLLAPDRPSDADQSKVHDTLLAGPLKVHVSESLPETSTTTTTTTTEEENNDDNQLSSSPSGQQQQQQDDEPEIDVHLSIPTGDIKMGRFMYPRRHKAFFEEPMLFPESSIGTFSMTQLLGNLNARLKKEGEEETKKKNIVPPKFVREDFHGRKFYLTATPHGVNPQYAKQDKHYDERNVQYDVRVMPITFHSNNTFTAVGTEKTLRGKYGITGEHGDRLWFQVNLFGFGRSAPGSVYSEGRLLGHDDKRGYLGEIHNYTAPVTTTTSNGTAATDNTTTMYFVEGEFYYGTDLKRTNKAHSWGTFSLQEISNTTMNDDLLDDDDDDDDDEDDEITIKGIRLDVDDDDDFGSGGDNSIIHDENSFQ
jgi:hypothetical protein